MSNVMDAQYGRTRQEACALAGYAALYQATKDEQYRKTAKRMLAASVPAEEMCPAWARMLFLDLEKDGCREAIEQVAKRSLPEPARLEEAFDVLPFRMAYEMKLNRMAWVNRVAENFRSLHKRLFDPASGLHRAGEGEGFSPESTGWFLMALVDSIDICDQQLYEHWRAMVDIYRVTLRGILRSGKTAGAEAQLAYSILKGVRLGLIDGERYLDTGLALAEVRTGAMNVGVPFMAMAEKVLAGRCEA